MDENSYNVGINYAFTDNSYVYGSYSRGFRYPVLDEQFSYLTSEIDTILMPRTSDNYEIVVSIASAPIS